MLNSKIDLFSQSWIDTVFEGRNKKYGAYEMRSNESNTTVRATVIGALVFASLISLPLIVKQFEGNRHKVEVLDQQITMVDLLPPPEKTEVDKIVQPPLVQEIKSIKDVKKFTPPVVAPEEEVVEEMVSQEVLKTADAGTKDVDGSVDGEVVIDERPVEKVEQVITEDNEIHPAVTVEVQPDFPGGLQEFDNYIVRNFNDTDIGGMGVVRVIIGFVIEKDGRLTDIKILRDGGYSNIAEEAVRVLSKCPKWKPGIINGKPVRVSYVKPIVIKIQ